VNRPEFIASIEGLCEPALKRARSRIIIQ